jgi:hypothetical protein
VEVWNDVLGHDSLRTGLVGAVRRTIAIHARHSKAIARIS